MLDHVSIGVSDIERARRFYDKVLATLGYRRMSDVDATSGYGSATAVFWIALATRTVVPDPESGLHFCFTAPTRESVDAFHAAVLQAGGSDNGKPGLRPEYGDNYYAAFAVDPDGYRLEAYCGG